MKPLILTIIAALSIILLACGGEEPAATQPLPPLTPTPVPTQDVQATVAASVQATLQAQPPTSTPVPPTNTPMPEPTPVPPTNTPAPEPTPVPPTNTSVPEPTPVPPTNTPVPEPTPVPPTSTPVPEPTPVPPTNTSVPEPTATPSVSQPTPTATQIPVGHSWHRPIPIGETHPIENTKGFTLRVREAMVFWAEDSWEIIDDEHPLNSKPPRTFEYLLINIQVRNHGSDTEDYDAPNRLLAVGEPPDGSVYRWLGANYCGGKPKIVLPRDFDQEHHSDIYGRRGNICFLVSQDDSGKLMLVDNGGPGAPKEDWRYFDLR